MFFIKLFPLSPLWLCLLSGLSFFTPVSCKFITSCVLKLMFFLSLLLHLHLFLLFAPRVLFSFWIIVRRYCSVPVPCLPLLFLLLPLLFFRLQFTLWKLNFCFVWFNLPASSVLMFCTVWCRCLSHTLFQQQHNNQRYFYLCWFETTHRMIGRLIQTSTINSFCLAHLCCSLCFVEPIMGIFWMTASVLVVTQENLFAHKI